MTSSAVVLFTHVIVPLYVSSDVRVVKKKLMTNVITYRKSIRSQKGSDGSLIKQMTIKPPPSQDPLTSKLSQEIAVEDGVIFNSAKYLFVSTRLAVLLPEIEESKEISQFTTPWPKQNFKQKSKTVSNAYNRRFAFVQAAISRVVLFFLAGLINMPVIVQDIIVEITSVSGLGYVAVMMVKLYAISPVFVAIPFVLLFALVALLYSFGQRDPHVRRLNELKAMAIDPHDEELNALFDEKQQATETDSNGEMGKGDDATAVDSEQSALNKARKMSMAMYTNLQRDIEKLPPGKAAFASDTPSPSGIAPARMLLEEGSEDSESSGNDKKGVDEGKLEEHLSSSRLEIVDLESSDAERASSVNAESESSDVDSMDSVDARATAKDVRRELNDRRRMFEMNPVSDDEDDDSDDDDDSDEGSYIFGVGDFLDDDSDHYDEEEEQVKDGDGDGEEGEEDGLIELLEEDTSEAEESEEDSDGDHMGVEAVRPVQGASSSVAIRPAERIEYLNDRLQAERKRSASVAILLARQQRKASSSVSPSDGGFLRTERKTIRSESADFGEGRNTTRDQRAGDFVRRSESTPVPPRSPNNQVAPAPSGLLSTNMLILEARRRARQERVVKGDDDDDDEES